MKKIVFVLLFALGMSACKDEPIVSFGQQTATRIQTENQIPKANFARVYIGTTAVNSGSFRFDGEFVIVESARYNLNRLISYQILNSSGTQTLFLNF